VGARYLQPVGSRETCKFEDDGLFVAAGLQRRVVARLCAVAALFGGGESREMARIE
jgi:hypothetical protein